MKSSKYSIKQSVATVAVLCLITDFSFADINCQNGLDYKNSCNPYKIKFIKVPKITKNLAYSNTTKPKSQKKQHYEARSYLDTLLMRYSSNYNGDYGLQSLIDRSGYKSLEYNKSKEPKKVATTATTKQESKKVELNTTKKELVSNKNNNFEDKRVVKYDKELEEQKAKQIAKVKEVVEPKKEKKEITISKKESEVSKKVVVTNKKESLDSNKSKKIAKKVQSKDNYKLYTIKKGDSLIKIAKRFALDVKELKALNSLDKNSTIKIGQKLKLPAKANIKLAETKVAKKDKNTQANKEYYVVKKGDTLSLIAKKNNISITKLREINRLSRSSKIRVGEKIYLKPTKYAKRKNRSFDFAKNIKFKKVPSLKFTKKIRVVATAYTSHRNQTDSTPFLAAWNNKIRPGMKIIAVSHDLIKKYGLTNGVKVKIMGLPGYYTVRDKMNKRLRNHIDIYMGVNKRKALRWGRRRIVLYW